MSRPTPKPYNPQEIEQKIYQIWEKSGYFNPDNLPLKKNAKPFCIIMPPPNANAPLHVGHAVFVTLQDIMIRYHRMKGEKTLWLPGADHAGFETQVVFDKKLEKEGRSRFQIPAEQLYKEIMEFTLANKKIMEDQLRKLGASCDWPREKFTLDKDIVEIVYQTFEKLKQDNLLYQGQRIVNWCAKHQTSLSDLEVKYVEREDPFYYIKYGPLELGTVRLETKFGDTAVAVNPKDKRYQKYVGQEIEIETLLGKRKIKVIADEAVDIEFGTGVVKITPAHDPDDFEVWQRHKSEIPAPIQVIDRFGKLTEQSGQYKGMKVLEARKIIAEDMAQKGLLDPSKTDHHYKHNVATCYKCGSLIEPMILDNQWFIKMTERLKNGKMSLRDAAVKAVKKGEIEFIPKRFEKVFFHWMKNLKDWNISRQIPWGIKIPAWYCTPQQSLPLMGYYYEIVPQFLLKGKSRTYRLRDHGLKIGDLVAFENSQTKTLFGHGIITRIDKKKIKNIKLPDPIHGGGYKTLDELLVAFRRHYPPDRIITGDTETLIYDFRFIPLTKENPSKGCGYIAIGPTKPAYCPNCGGSNLIQGEDVFDTWFSSGQWPFATLKTTGKNDFETFYPTSVMETAWDILFFWVARMIMFGLYCTDQKPFKYVYIHGLVRDKDRQKMSKSKGNVIDPLGIVKEQGADALRMSLVFGTGAGNDVVVAEDKVIAHKRFVNKIWQASKFVLTNLGSKFEPKRIKKNYTKKDKWILKELRKTTEKVTQDIEKFKFHEAAQEIYQFFWHKFCDKTIEDVKIRVKENKKDAEAGKLVLWLVLYNSLKLLHPFLPFVTEAIYQKLPQKKKKCLMVEAWPK